MNLGKYIEEMTNSAQNSLYYDESEFISQEENKMRQPFEGQLCKYTNVMKGWQYRWFVLTPETGMLEYYMMDEIKTRRPRGAVHLAGAVISPSDEDGQSFTLSAACGELYKLRACDARERQFWVNRLRSVAEHHTQSIAEKNPPLPHRDTRSPFLNDSSRPPNDHYSHTRSDSKKSSKFYTSSTDEIRQDASTKIQPVQNSASVADALSSVKDMLLQADRCHHSLALVIEDLPSNGSHIKCLDRDMLLLKATSHSILQCLQQCYTILQQQQLAANFPSGLPPGATIEWVEPQGSNIPLPVKSSELIPKSPIVSEATSSNNSMQSPTLISS